MVRANCRMQFTRPDIDFLFTHASRSTLSRVGARGDLNVSGIDLLLDDEEVFRRAYASRGTRHRLRSTASWWRRTRASQTSSVSCIVAPSPVRAIRDSSGLRLRFHPRRAPNAPSRLCA